ncbi:MAG: hypothetical protein ABIJ47_14375 [Candidatus Bathyarchaeota archaeon]
MAYGGWYGAAASNLSRELKDLRERLRRLREELCPECLEKYMEVMEGQR